MSRHVHKRLGRVAGLRARAFSKSYTGEGDEVVMRFADETLMRGHSFGADVGTAGELVFSTGMTGYPESMTDPSYAGQILTCTYPLIGNYGVPPRTRDELGLLEFFESEKIHVAGLVVSEYSKHWSHWQGAQSLSEWLRDEGVPAIEGIDTRGVTQRIRDHGAQLVTIGKENNHLHFVDPNQRNLVAEVSRDEPQTYGSGDVKIIAVDCGIKNNIIRDLARRGATVKVVPWDYDFNNEDYDGLFVSNGPGDPSMALTTIEHLKVAMETTDKPFFGICLGNQLMAIAAGGSTYKLPYGNRGQNQPAMDRLTGRCIITPQNHGYAVDMKTLPSEWREYFVNVNDGSNEGIIHTTKPFFTVQFHPEAKCGPVDAAYLFDQYLTKVREYKANPKNTTFYLPPLPLPDPPRVRKVLVLGSGGLQIGQAGEFDYSGSQAVKSLRENGIRSVLINPNIATVQTSPGLADAVYFSPLTIETVEDVIQKERPEGLLLGFGGQTGLNLGVALEESGILRKYGIKVLGTTVETIRWAEDRQLFNDKLAEIGVKVARSQACSKVQEAVDAAERIGFPVMVRVAYALGGLGSGFCQNAEEVRERVHKALGSAPQVLVEESIKGWKELEYEVVRDIYGNCVTVCNMENFDPMGIHTGESIVVAPSQTLNDMDYHMLREVAIKTVSHLKVVGECNIQYAFDPNSLDYRVIEINPRLSRSSALASKATGYPLAAVAAQLAQGAHLPTLRNSVTKDTSADFEPSLDYLVLKMPRWDVSKFHLVDRHLGSSMKSIGEVMAVGRKFEEVLQKAIRMVDASFVGFSALGWEKASGDELIKELGAPTDRRIFALKRALETGFSVDQLFDITKIDRWFLHKCKHIHDLEMDMREYKGRGEEMPVKLVRFAKQMGFSDAQIGSYVGMDELAVRAFRKSLGVVPCVKQIDTQAAEFPAQTNYLYSTYNGEVNDVIPTPEGEHGGVLVLGSGVYRIGSSVEFDYGAVECVRALRKMGEKTIMINYNPETVSTDYDESDKLYFEELSLERVLDVVDHERPKGVVVSVGGQLPQNIALKLHQLGVPVLGTNPENIDRAEDRYKFSQMLDEIGVDQPAWKELTAMEEAFAFAKDVGYPVLVRPSYVLSGAAMNVVYNDADLEELLQRAADVSPDHPVVMTKFLTGAKEIECDAVCQDGVMINWAISEHVEFAGVHSGDATLMYPSPNLTEAEKLRIREESTKIAAALQITGPANIQYLYTATGELKVIECNLRASRSLPFVAKVMGINMVENMARVFMGRKLQQDERCLREVPFYGVKAPNFSFQRLLGADPRLGVEMASTGEVGCFGKTHHNAFLKAVLSSHFKWPTRKTLLAANITEDMARELRVLSAYGYTIIAAADNAAEYCRKFGVPHTELSLKDCIAAARERTFDFLINFPEHPSRENIAYYHLRRKTADYALPVISNERVAIMLAQALGKHKSINDLDIQSYDYYHSLY